MPKKEVIVPENGETDETDDWTPIIGAETEKLLDGKPQSMRTRLQEEGSRILGRCVKPGSPPGKASRRTGLVLGYVQSGKTSSFTTVTAMAHDNNFKLVIVVAGTTEILQSQTIDRLAQDLDTSSMNAYNRWILFRNPSLDNDAGHSLLGTLSQLANDTGDNFDLGVPLVVVMKNHSHLANLISLLESASELSEIAALVIDDEAHMHSPDVGKTTPSATYSQMLALRKCLPIHSLLQYTATPQAPLLARFTDEMAPEFVCLLRPGPDYRGGEYFFVDHHDQFVQAISHEELYALDSDDFEKLGPPPSLRKAFLSYLLVCAKSRFLKRMDRRTMLIHPHSKKDVHSSWYSSIDAMKHDILGLLQSLEDSDCKDFVKDELAPVWDDLKQSDPELPDLNLLVPLVSVVLDRLNIKKVNSDGSAEVNWALGPYWVLVGGNLLGVGFTVEGLCTTHMMRSAGIRVLDTIQQRARFFGYKADYEDLCRAWLQPEVDGAFVDYVRHERALRSSLEDFDSSARPLSEWKRVFLLDERFRLTRKAAQRISLGYLRLDKSGWAQQKFISLEEVGILEANTEMLGRFLDGLDFHSDETISGDTNATRHLSAGCTLTPLRELLADLRYCGSDAATFAALGIQLASAAEDASGAWDNCSVVKIASGVSGERSRTIEWAEGGVSDYGRVTLHQGRNPKSGPARYLGDSKARNEHRITIQIHSVDLKGWPDGSELAVANAVPFIAVYLPTRIRSAVAMELG